MPLPRFAAFKSNLNGKYLNCVKSDDATVPNFVQYGSTELATTLTKFSIESANVGKNLFHIRSIYNQKYLRAESSSSRWICATASEPNEDQSNWGCTLFQITYRFSPPYELIHVYYGKPVELNNDLSTRPSCLYIYPDSSSNENNHAILDWEIMSVLPQHVVFKGDNGKYLKIHSQDSHDFLRFYLDDPHHSSVQHEVVITSDGKIRIKGPNNKFWRAAPHWIWLDSSDTTTNNPSTLFQPYKISNNVICLRNMGMNYFCKRNSADWKEDCLAANELAMSAPTKLTVEEALISRSIYNVQYRLSDGRIYGENVMTMDFQGAANGSNEVNTMGFTFSYEEEESQCWNSTVGMKLDYSMTIEAGIPFIVDTNIKITGEFAASYKWGETQKKSTPKGSKYSIEVKPRTSIKVVLIATKGYCDVPFSYTQRDVLVDGQTRITEHDDGLFTGVNCYNFHYQAEEAKPLPTTI